MLRTRGLRKVATAATAAGMLLATAVPAGASPTLTEVAGGFAGPLGLAVGEDGTIYVSEFFGGALTTIDRRGERSTFVEGGVAGVDAQGRGNVVYTETVAPEAEAPPTDTLLVRTNASGKVVRSTSLLGYETAENPDADQRYGFLDTPEDCLGDLAGFPFLYEGIVESNPYAVTVVPGGYLVADAAANAILHVGANGRISTVAVLPPVPQEVDAAILADLEGMIGADLPDCLEGEIFYGEPVPTDVEVGPDGAYYVSSLPGIPELPGAGSVFRIDPATGAVERYVTGLSGAVDLAVAEDGTVYVAELYGFSIAVVRDGVVVERIFADSPGAVEIGPDGTVYATTGVFGPSGSVVTLTP